VNTEADPKAGPRRPVTRDIRERWRRCHRYPIESEQSLVQCSVHPAGPITRTLHDVESGRGAGNFGLERPVTSENATKGDWEGWCNSLTKQSLRSDEYSDGAGTRPALVWWQSVHELRPSSPKT